MSKANQSNFELVIGAVDKLSAPFKRMNDSINAKTKNIRRLGESFNNLKRETGLNSIMYRTRGVGMSFNRVGREGTKLLGTVTGIATKLSLALGATGGGFFALSKNAAKAAEEAGLASTRVGLSTSSWQEYSYAMDQYGVETVVLEKAMRRLQDTGIKAAQGGKSQVELFSNLGISAKNAQGEVKNTDTLMREVADKVKSLSDAGQGAQATNLVRDLFGDRGTLLMPLLREGSEEIINLRKEAHKLGLVFSDDVVKDGSNLGDTISKVQNIFKGFGNQISKHLIPIFNEIGEKFINFIELNREFINSKIQEYAEKFKEAWPDIVDGALKAIETFKDFISKLDDFAESIGGWKNVLKGVALYMSMGFITSILFAGKAIGMLAISFGAFILKVTGLMPVLMGAFGALKVAIMATPVGWLIAGVAAIAASVYLIYRNWDGLKAYFGGLWAGVKAAFEKNWLLGVVEYLLAFNPVRWIADGMNALIDYLTGYNLYEIGGGIIDSMGEGISEKWQALVSWFGKQIAKFTNLMPDWLKGKLGIGDVGDFSDMGSGGGHPHIAENMATPELIDSAKAVHSTKVERQENTIHLVAPDGYTIGEVKGPKKGVKANASGVMVGQAMQGAGA